MSDAPTWEVAFLRRRERGSGSVVAGRVELQAPNLDSARQAAQVAIDARAKGAEGWFLGMLRPLTPDAPGTHRYRVVFAVWEANEDRFVRRDVHAIELWAADAQSARRHAQQEAHVLPAYQPAWRIREVVRLAPVRPGRSGRREPGVPRRRARIAR